MVIEAIWLRQQKDDKFPIGNDPAFRYSKNNVPIPNEAMRTTVSRKDMAGFYFIGESWALAVGRLIEMQERLHGRVVSPLLLDIGCGVGKTELPPENWTLT